MSRSGLRSPSKSYDGVLQVLSCLNFDLTNLALLFFPIAVERIALICAPSDPPAPSFYTFYDSHAISYVNSLYEVQLGETFRSASIPTLYGRLR